MRNYKQKSTNHQSYSLSEPTNSDGAPELVVDGHDDADAADDDDAVDQAVLDAGALALDHVASLAAPKPSPPTPPLAIVGNVEPT